jgi:hypothetical protein
MNHIKIQNGVSTTPNRVRVGNRSDANQLVEVDLKNFKNDLKALLFYEPDETIERIILSDIDEIIERFKNENPLTLDEKICYNGQTLRVNISKNNDALFAKFETLKNGVKSVTEYYQDF